ncbi:MAG TPA: 50S ribosomal protein L13 [Thermoplasmatales archaeon]|nr:50S ribosomal protein L13 [Thermoplasmatales archaeon]
MRVIDAEGATLGRLSTIVAKELLRGEEIVIINSEKAVISGKKRMIREEYKRRRELGTSRKGPFFPRMPDRIVKRSIRGMLPYQTPHGRAALKRLKCYIGIPEEFKDKEKEVIEEAKRKHVDFITIEELSRFLGAEF